MQDDVVRVAVAQEYVIEIGLFLLRSVGYLD